MTSIGTISIERFWRNDRFTDVTLRMEAAPADGENENPNPDAQEQPCTDLPLFSVAAAGISEWFKTRLEDAWEQTSAVKKARTEAGAQASNTIVVHDTFFVGEPDTVPEAVLQHAHTSSALPEDVITLAWMAKRADYWGMSATAEACMRQLLQLPVTSLLSDILFVASVLPEVKLADPNDKDHALYGKEQLLGKMVAHHFNSIESILLDTDGALKQFTQLPYELLEPWLFQLPEVGKERAPGSPPMVLGHPNSLVVLLTAWVNAQPQPLTKEQRQELTEACWTKDLSLTFYIQVPPLLDWWAEDRYHRQLAYRVAHSEALGGTAAKLHSATVTVSFRTASSRLLRFLWDGGHLELRPPVYHAGYMHNVGLHCRNGALTFCLRPSWPAPLEDHELNVKTGSPVPCVKVTVAIRSETLVFDFDERVHGPTLANNVDSLEALTRVLEHGFKVTLSDPR